MPRGHRCCHGPPRSCRRCPARSRLTPRETEVLRLLAKGMSNTEIGTAIFFGEATVKTHVDRILAKPQLRDRVQAVVWAYQTGLVQTGE